MYKVIISNRASRYLSSLDANTKARIQGKIDELKTDFKPHGYTKLEGSENLYRLRVGSYRIIYHVEEETTITVTVTKIAPRGQVYKR